MIIEKKIGILFWALITAIAMIMFSAILNPANAEYENELGHTCYTALTPEFQIYYICYPSLDDRLLGATSYSSLDIPELEFGEVVLNEGNTYRGEQ
tara:strand:- start:339 stop:626 length:288 start_codon:yes stop_codon:yes gene_type:complete